MEKIIATSGGHHQHKDFLLMELRKMTVNYPVATKDESGRKVLSMFQMIQDFYLNAAASEAIDSLGRHVWMKQRG